MIAYLDYNIITSIDENEYSLDKIYSRVDENIDQFAYSAAHVEEVDNRIFNQTHMQKEFVAKRLAKIQEITKGLYLYQDSSTNDVYTMIERPENVLKTISEVPLAKSSVQFAVNLITSPMKQQIRESLGIDAKQINNYRPSEVVTHLNKKLTGWGTNEPFIDLIERSIILHPDGKTFGLHNRIAGIFELLDMLGYWKDRETNTSNQARHFDSSHAFYAAHCDYFISDDKRTRNKAKVVYNIYDIHTKVVSSDGQE